MAKEFWKHENLYYAITNKKVIFGLTIFILVILLAIFGPMLTPYEYDDMPAAPDSPCYVTFIWHKHMGQDVFTMTVYGLRTTLIVGLIAGTIATIIGCVVGFLAGHYGGSWFDEKSLCRELYIRCYTPVGRLIIRLPSWEVRGIMVAS